MTAKELREKFLFFFQSKNHALISEKSIIPENDPSVLFCTAGMQPLIPYILGQEHPLGTRLVNSQRCIRTGDIDEIGDSTHLTSFEMLGNWSLGDYFKEEAIHFSYEFLTAHLNINPEHLVISVFKGNHNAPADTESAHIWHSLGISSNRIIYLGDADNWWGPAGQTGPCGPDTEIFVDINHFRSHEHKNKQPELVEIWNNVFMQYNKDASGAFTTLTRHCVDTGMGLERVCAILQGKNSVYDTELFYPLLQQLNTICGLVYGHGGTIDRAYRIIVDHVRTATFILGDSIGVTPANTGQGYILRRLIRRAVRFGRKLGIENLFLSQIAKEVITIYKDIYPLFIEKQNFIINEIMQEEKRFAHTCAKGEKQFEKIIAKLSNNETIISGIHVFHLYDTYGFPLEMTEELAREYNLTIDKDGFATAFEKHQKVSKSNTNTFKGGLSDHSEANTRLHTATHLLHQALRIVLGNHVSQKGSNITADRLRFDFSHPHKITPEQLAHITTIVNEQIQNELEIICEKMSLPEAKSSGALAFFDNKYEDIVTVYSIGEFSKEVCGGPHVNNTRELGIFTIVKEQSSSQGVRRIKAILKKVV